MTGTGTDGVSDWGTGGVAEAGVGVWREGRALDGWREGVGRCVGQCGVCLSLLRSLAAPNTVRAPLYLFLSQPRSLPKPCVNVLLSCCDS